MKFFRRKINPIFIEDEQYHWGGKRRRLRNVFLILTALAVVALIVFFATLPG